ncbi:MAG: hypothetical protein DME26_22180, partial [Verrucomicrobia bacterium]
INPDSASFLRVYYAGHVYRQCRHYDQAIEMYEQAPSTRSWKQEYQAQAYLEKGDYTNAIRLGKLAALAQGGDPIIVNAKYDALEYAFKEGGARRYWERELEFELSRNDERHLMRMAVTYARLNRSDEALSYLTRAIKETPGEFGLKINTNPSFDSLRTDRRFAAFLNELWRKK